MRPAAYLLVLAGTAGVTAAVVAASSTVLSRRPPGDRFVLESKLAAAVARGENVTLPGNVNEWMLRWDTADRLSTAPEAAILGSSHSLGVTGADIGVPQAMNFSASGSSLPDHLVTTGILSRRGLIPREWVLFVDPWFFDPAADSGTWKMRADDLRWMEEALNRFDPDEPTTAYATGAGARTDAGYTLEPILAAIDSWLNERLVTVHETGAGETSAAVLRADGARQEPTDAVVPAPSAVQALAQRQFQQRTDRLRYGTYMAIDPTLWRLFSEWLKFCRQDGARVWIVLPPYHPAIFSRIVAAPGNQLQVVESRVRARAAELGMAVVGSYDPDTAGVRAEDFRDGDHLSASGLRRLLAPVRAGQTEIGNP